MTYRGAGTGFFMLTLLLAAIMLGGDALLLSDVRAAAGTGICLPSPNLWPLQDWISRLAAGVVTVGLMVASWFLNKQFNIVRHSDFTLPSLGLIFLAANPLVSAHLGTSLLLLGVNLIGISLLFPSYSQTGVPRNATQETFALATFLGIGSMTDYAFVVMIPYWIIAMGMLRILRPRELMALILGLIAPYWVAVGFGLVTPGDFRIPKVTNMLTGYIPSADLTTILIGTSLLTLFGALFALNTAMRLYAGNPRPRTFNYILYLLIPYCIAAMILDSGHLGAYLASLLFPLAVSYSNLFALYNIPKTKLWLSAISLLMAVYWGIITVP